MPAKLPDELIVRICEMRRKGMTVREIGRELGIDHSTVSRHCQKYIEQEGQLSSLYQEARGGPPPNKEIGKIYDKTDVDGTVELIKLDRPATVEELMALCQLDPTKWIPQYYKPNTWQGWGKFKRPEGEVAEKVQLIQSKCSFKRIMTEELEHAILNFVREHVPSLPAERRERRPIRQNNSQMVVWGLWDAHLGLYAWNSEVRASFDVKIASNRIMNTIDDIRDEIELYPIERIVMPIGNDFMHFDSVRMKTSMGEHYLDVDTRFGRVYDAALRCLAYQVDTALEICDDVQLLYVPGNHDVTSSYTLTAALAQRYRNEPRVQVDLSYNPRKYVKYGGVLIGFDHGRDAKPNQLALVLPNEAAEHWSSSTYREIQIGDKHQRWEKVYESVTPTNGITIRRNPALCNVDAWHHKQALIGEPVKSVEAWRYDREAYRGSHVAWARDEREMK